VSCTTWKRCDARLIAIPSPDTPKQYIKTFLKSLCHQQWLAGRILPSYPWGSSFEVANTVRKKVPGRPRSERWIGCVKGSPDSFTKWQTGSKDIKLVFWPLHATHAKSSVMILLIAHDFSKELKPLTRWLTNQWQCRFRFERKPRYAEVLHANLQLLTNGPVLSVYHDKGAKYCTSKYLRHHSRLRRPNDIQGLVWQLAMRRPSWNLLLSQTHPFINGE
jgi:hypothetical protein